MTTFHITAPPQTRFNRETGLHEPLKPYSSPSPIFGVHIMNGQGETDDPRAAVEFADMGYTVTPDPRPELLKLQPLDGEEPEVEAEPAGATAKSKAKPRK